MTRGRWPHECLTRQQQHHEVMPQAKARHNAGAEYYIVEPFYSMIIAPVAETGLTSTAVPPFTIIDRVC